MKEESKSFPSSSLLKQWEEVGCINPTKQFIASYRAKTLLYDSFLGRGDDIMWNAKIFLNMATEIRANKSFKKASFWELIENGFPIALYMIKELELRPLMNDLLKYYKKITDTPNWRNKFKQFEKKHMVNYRWRNNGLGFYKVGFKRTNNKCYETYPNHVASFDIRLYSFWHRRYLEGNMSTTKLILDWLMKSTSSPKSE